MFLLKPSVFLLNNHDVPIKNHHVPMNNQHFPIKKCKKLQVLAIKNHHYPCKNHMFPKKHNFIQKPKHTDRSAPINDYPEDWGDRSRKYKQWNAWTCLGLHGKLGISTSRGWQQGRCSIIIKSARRSSPNTLLYATLSRPEYPPP